MSETKPPYEPHTPAPHVTRFVCKTCGLGVENTIDGDCERCYVNTLSRPLVPRRENLLAYPQPTNYLQEVMDATVAVRVDEPSLERIRALVEETVRRVLHEKQYFFVLNKVLSPEELRHVEQMVKEHGLQALSEYIPDIVAIEVTNKK